tara:strand:+ start:7660 stop:9330 length:1671 start_codon:yes stop_codon:yes gene_type:complete
MLQYLKVENLALIESVEMECQPGFTAVTGETGAGKSVIMGALSLLSGRRADRSMIRSGADSCEVQASLFLQNPSRMIEAMEEAGLRPLQDGELVLTRKIQAAGGQRILVNGQIATLGQLAALGDIWLELHGPEAPLALFHRSAQVDLLDAFAGNEDLREDFAGLYRQWSELTDKIERIEGEGSLSEDEQVYLKSQIDEIRMLNISPEWLEKLEGDFRRVSNAREIDQRLSGLEDSLSGPKGAPARLSDVYRYGNKLRELVPEEIGSQMDRLDALMVELNDLFGELESMRSILEVDAYEIEEVESNMKLWMAIRRRHGGSVQAVLEKCEAMEERLESHGNIEETLAKLAKEESALRKKLEAVGDALTRKRAAVAGPLGSKVQELLTRLGFKKPVFRIEVEDSTEWSERGTSMCEYLFSGTAGQAPMPLGKVASSGEIARVTLALKTVLAAVDHTAVLVFDEIDANVGGEVGREIGRELSRLAEDNQVFTITHLPQVAAMASSHFVVTKDQTEDQASVTLRGLDADRGERVDEIARMLGDRRSKTARSHAEELLSGNQ